MTFPVVYLVYRSYNIYLTRVDEQQKHIGEMADLHLRTIEALALAIDAKDDTTSAHLRRVQVYASEVGRELGLDRRWKCRRSKPPRCCTTSANSRYRSTSSPSPDA